MIDWGSYFHFRLRWFRYQSYDSSNAPGGPAALQISIENTNIEHVGGRLSFVQDWKRKQSKVPSWVGDVQEMSSSLKRIYVFKVCNDLYQYWDKNERQAHPTCQPLNRAWTRHALDAPSSFSFLPYGVHGLLPPDLLSECGCYVSVACADVFEASLHQMPSD